MHFSNRRAEYDRHKLFRAYQQQQQQGTHRRRTAPAEFAYPPGFCFRSPFDIFREFFGDPFAFGVDPLNSPLFAFGQTHSNTISKYR
jgi:hypothetical protein